MKLFAINIILLFSFLQGFTQDFDYEYYDEEEKRIAWYLTLRNNINPSDYILGTEMGLVNKKRNLAAFFTFDARPYRKGVLEYRGNNQFYQFREERYFLGVGAEYTKGFERLPLAGFVQLNGTYTFGKYGGTEMKPNQGWLVVPRFGVALDLKSHGWLKVGYSYLDTKTYRLEKHRLYIAISGFLTGN